MTQKRLPNPRKAASLQELLQLMQAQHAAWDAENPNAPFPDEWDDLPVFGGVDPRGKRCLDDVPVWSWDEESVLVGESADELMIMSRN